MAATLVVVVGLLTAACSSSSGHAASTTPVADTNPATNVAATSNWSRVDVTTGSITPVPANTATAGAFYVQSPDHSKVAYNPCCSWETAARVADLDGTHVRPVSAAGTDGVGEQWSRDGSLIAYQQRGGSGNQLGNLFVLNVATGQRSRVTNLDHKQWGWWFTFPSFSPDGKSLLYQQPYGHLPNEDNRGWDLWSAPIAGGTPTIVQRGAAWGSYSPDGKQVAYISGLRERDFTGSALWIKNLHTGTPRALVSGGSLQWARWSPDGKRIAYSDGSAVCVVNVASRKIERVAHGSQPEWHDNHTLIISN